MNKIENHKSANKYIKKMNTNGEAVPYLEDIELNLMFPEKFLGKETEVLTLA